MKTSEKIYCELWVDYLTGKIDIIIFKSLLGVK